MGLRVGDDGVAPGDSRPAAGVDVQGQEPAGLRGGGVEVAVPGHGEPCGVVLLGHPHLGATPVTVGSEHRAKLLRLALALGAQCSGVKPSQNVLLVANDHGPSTSTAIVWCFIVCPPPAFHAWSWMVTA